METETNKTTGGRKKKGANADAPKAEWKDVADASAKAERAAKPPRVFRQEVVVRLSDEEVAVMKDAHIDSLQRIDALEEKKKQVAGDCRAEIILAKTLERELRASATGAYDEDGKKIYTAKRTLDCFEDPDVATGTVFTRRCDTKAVVGNPKGRAMTLAERQAELPGLDKPAAETKPKGRKNGKPAEAADSNDEEE